MKIDLKTILILVLTLICCVFVWKSLYEGDKQYKKELEKLREENKMIQQKRDSLLKEREKLELDLTIVRKHNDSLIYRSNVLEKEVKDQKNKANLSRQELDKLRKELEETKIKIEEIKKHPANRDGNDLLNSLKSKSKK